MPGSSAGLPAKPVVIGHSFGGLIVQRLLGQDLAVAGAAIDPAGRLQRRHVVLGFPYAVVTKYGDDEGGRSTRPSMRSAMRPGTALCRPMKGCRLHEHRP